MSPEPPRASAADASPASGPGRPAEPDAPAGSADPAPPRRPRRWIGALSWAAVVPCAVWAVLRTGGWTVGFPWIQLVAFTPYVAAGAAAVTLAALVLRRWRPAVAGLAATIPLAVAVVPRALPDAGPPAGGPALRVVAANLRKGQADTAALLALVRQRRADVLTVQELTPDAARRLAEAGLGTLLPYRIEQPREGVGGSAVYARYPLRGGPAIDYGGFRQSSATLAVPGAPPVEVVSVHPCAPRHRESTACWSAGLRALPPADLDGPVRILAGDFNATLDHGPLRDLLATGYRDAADATGDGLTATWPTLPRPVLPVVLDRVVADRRAAVRDFGVHPLPRTDHAAVFAELTLPAG